MAVGTEKNHLPAIGWRLELTAHSVSTVQLFCFISLHSRFISVCNRDVIIKRYSVFLDTLLFSIHFHVGIISVFGSWWYSYTVQCVSVSADEHALFRSEALPVDVVLLQFFVAGVPEPWQDALHVQGIHSVGGHHTVVNLHQTNVWERYLTIETSDVYMRAGQIWPYSVICSNHSGRLIKTF